MAKRIKSFGFQPVDGSIVIPLPSDFEIIDLTVDGNNLIFYYLTDVLSVASKKVEFFFAREGSIIRDDFLKRAEYVCRVGWNFIFMLKG